MEFSEKLQMLRKQKGLTQEALANSIYVSRTAISKWESGRGYPSIDSLKALSKFFSIPLDDLLSSEAVLRISKADSQARRAHLFPLIFGLLDCASALFFFLPLFGQSFPDGIRAVTLPALVTVQPHLKTVYFTLILATVLLGIAVLSLQNRSSKSVIRYLIRLSLLFGILALLLFTLSRQPYGAVLFLAFLSVKVIFLFYQK